MASGGQDKVRNIVEEIVGPVIQSQICPLTAALAQKAQSQDADGKPPFSYSLSSSVSRQCVNVCARAR
jgi:hypothetical protein